MQEKYIETHFGRLWPKAVSRGFPRSANLYSNFPSVLPISSLLVTSTSLPPLLSFNLTQARGEVPWPVQSADVQYKWNILVINEELCMFATTNHSVTHAHKKEPITSLRQHTKQYSSCENERGKEEYKGRTGRNSTVAPQVRLLLFWCNNWRSQSD